MLDLCSSFFFFFFSFFFFFNKMHAGIYIDEKNQCNRASPCSACIARKTESECTYATTMEEREAIAQADLIAELRATRNKLQNQLAKTGAGAAGFGSGASTSTSSGMYIRDEQEEEALEAVYAALRGGSLDLVREVVGRIRAGEGVRDVLGWLEGGVGVGVGGIAVSVERD